MVPVTTREDRDVRAAWATVAPYEGLSYRGEGGGRTQGRAPVRRWLGQVFASFGLVFLVLVRLEVNGFAPAYGFQVRGRPVAATALQRNGRARLMLSFGGLFLLMGLLGKAGLGGRWCLCIAVKQIAIR